VKRPWDFDGYNYGSGLDENPKFAEAIITDFKERQKIPLVLEATATGIGCSHLERILEAHFPKT
jgi:hypothetical protein